MGRYGSFRFDVFEFCRCLLVAGAVCLSVAGLDFRLVAFCFLRAVLYYGSEKIHNLIFVFFI